MIQRISVKTGARVDFQDISQRVEEVVKASGVKDGVCHLFLPHTTAGLVLNEHADPSVAQDIEAQLDLLVPQSRSYRHLEGNAPAHIKASLVGNSCTLLIENGKLILGTWQGIFLCEFDGPRTRTVLIKIVPS